MWGFVIPRGPAQPDIAESWRVHTASGARHPFHVHLDMFRGVPAHQGESGWKDTVWWQAGRR